MPRFYRIVSHRSDNRSVLFPGCSDFYNWNRIKVRYCDGASFTGEVEAVDPVRLQGLFLILEQTRIREHAELFLTLSSCMLCCEFVSLGNKPPLQRSKSFCSHHRGPARKRNEQCSKCMYSFQLQLLFSLNLVLLQRRCDRPFSLVVRPVDCPPSSSATTSAPSCRLVLKLNASGMPASSSMRKYYVKPRSPQHSLL